MKKSRSLRRMVALISLMLVLFAIVMPTLYAGLSTHIFAEAKLRELYPRTQFLAELAAEYFASGEPMQEYEWLLTMDSRQWDAAAYLLDAEGNILSGTDYADGGGYASEISDFSALAAQVLAGETLSSVSHTTVRMERGNSRVDMLIVGVPVQVDGQTMGAVLMLKPLKEILSAMSTLTTSLWLASLAVFALMLPLAYLFSKRISRPLAEMRDAALRMAGGDFSVRADDGEKGEIGDLARALNHLSSELGRTISELTAERNRALGIVNALGEGILVVDSQLRPTQTNPSLQTILLSAGDGQSEAALPPEIWEDFRAALRENREIDRPLALGRLRLHVTIIPTGGQRGPVGAIGVFRDETQAYHLEQTRREYVANVSHELRTPLTAVRALVEPLRDGLIRTDEKRQETYGIILRETMRLSRLVDDMLELSRLQSGGAALQKMLFTAAPQIRETASIYAAKAEKTGHILRLDLPDGDPLRVQGNPDRMEQVLVVLLDNAFSYTPPGSTIVLSVSRQEQRFIVSVEDNGPGIAPEDLPHVFDRFYKADKAHRSGGTGLGLAIAHEVIVRLGEEIGVENRPGGGARFWFSLRCARD